MSTKFIRSFVFRYQYDDNNYVEASYPLTVDFSIKRNIQAEANNATFTIYNLNEKTRSKIVKDQYDMSTKYKVNFYAGYAPEEKNVLAQCFRGVARRAYSVREGSDFKTIIEAYDGTISSSTDEISLQISANTNQQQIIQKISQELKGVDKFSIGTSFINMSKRSLAFLGRPEDLLKEITGNSFFIDSGAGYVMAENDVVIGDIRKISYENGLIGTPIKSENLVTVDMIFEPRLKPAQLIELESKTDKRFNGVYKVLGFIHRGIISKSVGGDLKTTVTLQNQPNYTVIYDKSKNQYTAQVQS